MDSVLQPLDHSRFLTSSTLDILSNAVSVLLSFILRMLCVRYLFRLTKRNCLPSALERVDVGIADSPSSIRSR